tara:strand:+ start:120 stop:551 length:432 start_codon:yes stop_codon:yes gene_type:complete
MQIEVKINLILHATENKERVLERLENIFKIKQDIFKIQEIPGHFNNPILLISSILKKSIAKNFTIIFFSKMEKDDFEYIYENVDECVTSAGLSLRISKQKLVSEIVKISKEDSIKINISTPVYIKSETKMIYQKLMKNDTKST